MPAYWIAHVTVTDPDRYRTYQSLAPVAFARFGARFLARGGEADTPEGPSHPRHVVIEFPDLEKAKACYHSPEYQHAVSFRKGAALADIVIIEAYDGPQPG